MRLSSGGLLRDIDNFVQSCTILAYMQQVTVSGAREEWAQLVNRVFAGEEFLVVKNKIPVARLLPVVPEFLKLVS